MNGLLVRLCVNCNEPMREIAAYDPYAAVFRCMNNCGAEDAVLTHDQVAAELGEPLFDSVIAAVEAVMPAVPTSGEMQTADVGPCGEPAAGPKN